VEVLGPFRILPREFLQATANTVLAGLMRTLLPIFTRKCAPHHALSRSTILTNASFPTIFSSLCSCTPHHAVGRSRIWTNASVPTIFFPGFTSALPIMPLAAPEFGPIHQFHLLFLLALLLIEAGAPWGKGDWISPFSGEFSR
jgi:hypothetical protein